MGYTTDFYGTVTVDPPLNETERTFLDAFANTRRMDRKQGPHFVGATGYKGQDVDEGVINNNRPPLGQPGLWCQWLPSRDGTLIEWDGSEKFYHAEEWMDYIIRHYMAPDSPLRNDPAFVGFTFDHKVNGTIDAQGEDSDDRWRIVVKDNVVTTQTPTVIWPEG